MCNSQSMKNFNEKEMRDLYCKIRFFSEGQDLGIQDLNCCPRWHSMLSTFCKDDIRLICRIYSINVDTRKHTYIHNIYQARSQDFAGEEPDSGSQCQKRVRKCHPQVKFWKTYLRFDALFCNCCIKIINLFKVFYLK